MTVYVRKSLAVHEVSNSLPLDSVNCIITQKGTQKTEFLLYFSFRVPIVPTQSFGFL